MNTNKIKHIGGFTSGDDCPGMNAALYAITKAAGANGIKVTGIRKGYEGMIDSDFSLLKINDLQKMVHRGGTFLRTARSQRFLTFEGRKLALKHLQKNNIDALIAIGGDGTFKGLLAFSDHQAFLTETALTNIAETYIYNQDCFEKEIVSGNEVN